MRWDELLWKLRLYKPDRYSENDRTAFITQTVITGCEARGDRQSAYLSRYSLPRLGVFRANLHIFHRSDNVEHHDHPWPFVTIILWRGYIEETLCRRCKGDGKWFQWQAVLKKWISGPCPACSGAGVCQKRVWPGSVLYRPATWRHRVILPVEGKKAITIVIMGKRIREWGFFVEGGKRWQLWTDYFRERGC